MKRSVRVVMRGSLLACLVLGAATAAAQTTGDLDGAITDSAKGPLPGVSLEARSPALQGVRVATSDLKGLFRFPILPPGVYTVSANLPGFKPAEESLRVGLGETAWLPITMILAAKAEVEISGEAPLIDTSSTRLGTSLTSGAISRLPLGRNYSSVATTVAGTGQDIGGITVYGATGLENQYIIDGLNTTGIRIGNQGKSLNAEFVQEVEVRTGGYEAEYGQVFGGNINVITKSGGNEFHGDVFGYYDSGSLASADKHAEDRDAVNAAHFFLPLRVDAGVDVGGYFLKDRLWFFGAFDRVVSDQDYERAESLTYPTSGAPVSNLKSGTDTTRTNLFSGKLTLRAGPSHTFAVSVFGDPTELNGRGGDPRAGPDSAILLSRKSGGTDISAKWDGLLGSHFILQAQYGYHEEQNRESSDFAESVAIRQRRRQVVQYIPGSGPAFLSDETYRRNVYKLTGAAFLGSHEIKAGINFENLNSSSSLRLGGDDLIVQVLAGSGAFRYATHGYLAKIPLNCVAKTDGSTGNFGFIDPTTCNGYEVAHGASQSPTARNLALFAQDSWKIAGNLTLNAGLRYEEQRVLDPNGNAAIKLTGEWSPRIGVVWDPLKNGRSKIFASAGRYYQVIPQDLQVRALGGQVFAYAYNYTGDRLDNINNSDLLPFAYAFGPDYVPPGIKGTYQDELVAGVEYEILKNWSIGIKGIYRALGRVIEDRCDLYDPRVQLEGKFPADSLALCSVINVGVGELGQIADPTNPDCFSDYPKSTKPTPCDSVKGRRYFRGLQLDVKRSFANRFFLQASYLYSKLEGSYDGFVNQDSGQSTPSLDSSFDYIDVVPNNFGRLALDRTHQAKLSGSYVLPFGLQVGLNSFFSTGRPLSIYGFARPGYFVFLVPRGSYDEMPSTYSIDLHLEYPLRLGMVTLLPILDVFNLTNTQTATNRNQVYNNDPNGDQSPPFTNSQNPRYGKDTAWQSPRLVRVGMRVSF